MDSQVTPPAGAPDERHNVQDLIPAYVLGADDEGERLALLRAAEDPAVAAELAAYSTLAEGLLYAAPQATAPAGLAARLRASLAEPETTGRTATLAAGTTLAATVTAPLPAAPLPAAPVPAVPMPAAPQHSGRRWHWPQIATAAAIALLFLLNLAWIRELIDLRGAQNALEQQLSAQTQQLTEQDNILAALVNNQGERYTMNSVEPGSSAVARVAWLADSKLAVLRAEQFPQLQPGHVYQLWLLRDGKRTSAGTFKVNDQGCGTLVFNPTESLDSFQGMGITPEPDGGSAGPTAPPVVRAQL